jgi:hypothetical protein
MTIRTIRRTIAFRRPFYLKGVDRLLPPGDYSVLREHQGAQDLAAVTTACTAPLEASTWPSLVGAENLADIVELLLAQARIVKRT